MARTGRSKSHRRKHARQARRSRKAPATGARRANPASGSAGGEPDEGSEPLFHRVLPMGYGLDDEIFEELAPTRSETATGGALAIREARPDLSSAAPAELMPPGDRAGGWISTQGHDAFRELVVSRFGYLNRQLSDFQVASAKRAAEERRETRLLLVALSAVLIFCFAAFYMNQIEVRDLHTGLQEEIEQRSTDTVDYLEQSIESLRNEHLPGMHAQLERKLRERDGEYRKGLATLQSEIENVGTRTGTQVSEALRIMEDHLQRVQKLSRDIHQLQIELLARRDAGRGKSGADPADGDRPPALPEEFAVTGESRGKRDP